jgi:hypothetical protein
VTSRAIADLLAEQLGSLMVPVAGGCDGHAALARRLREPAVGAVDAARDGLRRVRATVNAGALQDIADPVGDARDRGVCLRVHRWGQALLDAAPGTDAGRKGGNEGVPAAILVPAIRGGYAGRAGSILPGRARIKWGLCDHLGWDR